MKRRIVISCWLLVMALLQKGYSNSRLPPVVVILEHSEGSQGGVHNDIFTFLHFGQS